MLSPIMFSTSETRRVFSKIIPNELFKNASQAKFKPSSIAKQYTVVRHDGTVFSKLSHMLDRIFKW